MDDELKPLLWYFMFIVAIALVCGIGQGLCDYYKHVENVERIRAGATNSSATALPGVGARDPDSGSTP